MGLFSNLFGGKKPDSPLLDKLLDVMDKAAEQVQQNAPAASQAESAPAEPAAAEEPVLSGLPWGGSVPPAEENSFTFNGTYLEYFDRIFHAEFPEYSLETEQFNNGKRAAVRFMKDGQCALVVELLNDSSSVFRLRRDTLRAGIPYLRYYYDHEGWWNTRSYVTERTRAALNR